MNKILIIEDDLEINALLADFLKEKGYAVHCQYDGLHVLDFLNKEKIDLIILDIMLPYRSGDIILSDVRKKFTIPVIIISAKETTQNKIDLLRLGADDYITKPFDIEELFARIRVSLRNKKDFKIKNTLIYDNLKIDLSSKTLYKDDEPISLTKTEYNLMEFFMINKEICVTREKVIEELWGFDYEGDGKIIDVYVNSLRKKIDDVTHKYIHTVRGFGYMLSKKEIL